MTRVLVVGGVSLDQIVYLNQFPQPAPQTIFSRGMHETVGSTGAGKALNLHKLGLSVTLHGLIGDDLYGRQIVSYFNREGVHFIHDADPRGTDRHINLMNDEGQRISIYLTNGSAKPQVDLPNLARLMYKSDYAVLNILDYCRPLLSVAKEHKKEFWCDIHDYDGSNPYHRDFIEAASYIFMSSDNLPDYKPFMRQLIDKGKKLVVCTHGRQGATALTPGGDWIDTPVIDDYPLKDTNGAGDAFFAGYIYGHSRGHDIETCLRLATIVAGLCITSSELAYERLTPAKLEEEYAKHYPSPEF